MNASYHDASEKRVNVIVKLNKADKENRHRLSKKSGFGLVSVRACLIKTAVFLAAYLAVSFTINEILGFISSLIYMSDAVYDVLYYAFILIMQIFIAGAIHNYLKIVRNRRNGNMKFSDDHEKMIIGFGKKDILIRAQCACVKLPYKAIKKAAGFKEGLLIYFESSQRIFIPWRFVGEQSFMAITNCLNSAIRRKFSMKESVAVAKEPEIVEPDEFFVAQGSPEFEFEYRCEKEDYFRYFRSMLKIKLGEIARDCIYFLIAPLIYIVYCFAVGNSEKAWFMTAFIAIAFVFSIVFEYFCVNAEAKRRAKNMYRHTKGVQKLTAFENCVLNEHKNGSWQIIPCDENYYCGNDEHSLIIYGTGGGIFVPMRFAEEYSSALRKKIDRKKDIVELGFDKLTEIFGKRKSNEEVNSQEQKSE